MRPTSAKTTAPLSVRTTAELQRTVTTFGSTRVSSEGQRSQVLRGIGCELVAADDIEALSAQDNGDRAGVVIFDGL